MNEEVVTWARVQLSKGYTKEQIYNSLVQQRYPPYEAEKILNLATTENNTSTNTKKSFVFFLFVIISVVIIGGLVSYFVFFSRKPLAEDVCVYDSNRYIICGRSWVLISEGNEYNITKNKPFYFLKGENSLIALVNPNFNINETYLLYLEIGTHTLNEETSRRAVGKGIVRGFGGEPSPDQPSDCEEKEDIYDKDDCYIELAAKQTNEDLCEKVTYEDNKDTCYYGVAMKKNDANLCNLITNQDSRQLCISLINSQ